MYKFRSMYDHADQLRDELIAQTGADPKRPKWENDPRITRVGKWIRRTSIDELPQLINVLRGEMSLVGPRPPTPDEVEHYEPWHRQRLNILPGATSLWQVSGRSKVPFEEQCLLDIYYIENWSIALDIQILLRTIPNVLLGNGAY
jgi:lipopolysaccharide/colanic/teichoic acid biosynthesis glycosyltransferase